MRETAQIAHAPQRTRLKAATVDWGSHEETFHRGLCVARRFLRVPANWISIMFLPLIQLIHQLVATDVALDELGARAISAQEAEQLARTRHVVVHNPHDSSRRGPRLLLIGRTNEGRSLTLVVERTVDPTTWLIVTGWSSTDAERELLEPNR
jgi:hypothetical protein